MAPPPTLKTLQLGQRHTMLLKFAPKLPLKKKVCCVGRDERDAGSRERALNTAACEGFPPVETAVEMEKKLAETME